MLPSQQKKRAAPLGGGNPPRKGAGFNLTADKMF
jgi:hypothetical protein